MTLPLVLGFTALGDGDLRKETHTLAQRLEGEGAYSRDPDSAHDRELLAKAEIAALPRQRLDAVDANLLPDQASELLSAWEDALDIPNNAARGNDDRRARALAYFSLPRKGALASMAALMEELGLSGQSNILGGWTPAHGGTITTGQPDPDGGTGAVLIRDLVATMGGAFKSTSAYQRGTVARGELRVKKQDAVMLEHALAKTLDYANLLPAPGSITWSGAGGTPATVTTGQVDPAGGTDAVTLTDASSGAAARAEVAPVSYASGHAVWESILVKKDPTATHFSEIRLEYPGAGDSARIALRLDTGAYAVNVGSFEEIRVYDLGAWWFVAAKHAGAADTSIRVAVYPAFGTTASFPATDPTATGSVTVYGARIADATADPDAADPTALSFARLEWQDESGTPWAAANLHLGDGRVATSGDVDVTMTEEADWWRVAYALAPLATDGITVILRAAAGLAASFPTTSLACTGAGPRA